MKITITKVANPLEGQNYEVQIQDVPNDQADALADGRDYYDIGAGYASTVKGGILGAIEALEERGLELTSGTQIHIQ
jgi:hypothetical protein